MISPLQAREIRRVKIKEILNTFAYVTTGVVFATAIFISIFWKKTELSVSILWEILSVSLLCSLGNLFYYSKNMEYMEALTKQQLAFRTILHYLYINVVVIGSGFIFEWYYWYRADMMGAMIVIILIIFVSIWFINLHRDKKLAMQLNEKLKEYYTKE